MIEDTDEKKSAVPENLDDEDQSSSEKGILNEIPAEVITDTMQLDEQSDSINDMGDGNSQISSLKEKIRDLEEALLRARAESENVRKRAAKDVQAAHKFGTERFVKEILPLKDSLELGIESAQTSPEISSIIEGFSLTLKMFVDALGRLDVKELDPVDESFDPEKHQAMTTEYAEGKPSGIVVKVFQKGYSLNERLVRPALVVVSTDKGENSS